MSRAEPRARIAGSGAQRVARAVVNHADSFILTLRYAGPALILGLTLSMPVQALNTNETAPDWRLADTAGIPVDYYADSAGAVSVILFWATWCPFCRTLMPHLQKVADEYSGRPVRFYALDVWEDGDPVAHMKKRGFTFKLLLQADRVAENYGVHGTPGLFVVDPDHRVIYRRGSGEDDFDVVTAVRESIAAALASH